MKKFTSFEDIQKTMIKPFDNPEFYALILGDKRYNQYADVSITKCFGYDLGKATYDTYYDFLKIAIEQYLQNVDFKTFKSIYTHNTEEQFRKLQTFLRKTLMPTNIKTQGNINKNLYEFVNSPVAGKAATTVLGIGRNIDPEHNVLSGNDFFYCRSSNLNPNLTSKHITDQIKHRLYLTVDTDQRAEMAKKIIEKCNKKGIPYQFKVYYNMTNLNQQSDTMVIYLAEDQQVVDYVNFINEIIEENKELAQHIHAPSPHLGVVNEYIGYGFEPKFTNGKNSYSKLLAQTLKYKVGVGISIRRIGEDLFEYLGDPKNGEWTSYHTVVKKHHQELEQLYQKQRTTLAENQKIKAYNEEFKNYICSYLKRTGLNNLDFIKKLRTLLEEGYLRTYLLQENGIAISSSPEEIRKEVLSGAIKRKPLLPKDNMFGIDLDTTLAKIMQKYRSPQNGYSNNQN